MRSTRTRGAQVMSDGRRVWINSGRTGAALARFSVFGDMAMIDVHRELHEQVEQGECLDCGSGACTMDMWQRFKESVLKHHGVSVAERHRPKGIQST